MFENTILQKKNQNVYMTCGIFFYALPKLKRGKIYCLNLV